MRSDAEHERVVDQSQRDDMQRRQRLHPERYVPERNMHGCEPDRVCGGRCVPRRGDVRSIERSVLESDRRKRDDVQRRKRLHADRYLPKRNMHGGEQSHLRSGRPMPRRRHLRSFVGHMFEPRHPGWKAVQRRLALHDQRRLHGGNVRWHSFDLRGHGPMPRRRNVRCDDREVLESDRCERDVLRRLQRVHEPRCLHERCLRRRGLHVRGERVPNVVHVRRCGGLLSEQ